MRSPRHPLLDLVVLVGACVAVLMLAWPRAAGAEDRVIVRGNYYREPSTRVLQPEVSVQVDVPDERLSLGAAYMLDAISSASIASGAAAVTGGDAVFTEVRHETTGFLASRLGNWGLGGFFRYSTETDYISRSMGVSASRDILQRSVTFSLSYAYNFDRVFRIQNNTGARAPWCSGNVVIEDCRDGGHGLGSNLLQVHYLSGGYTHALHKTLLSVLTLEVAHATGPQDNPYRGSQIPGVTSETHPYTRTRVAPALALRWMVPRAKLVIEPRYRFTTDTWNVQTHALDTRLHFRVQAHLRLRLRYRYYTQNAAFFFRDAGDYTQPTGECTRDEPTNCATADPKIGKWHSHTPGLQLTYELDGLAARFPRLGWLERGWIEATYNHVFQTNRFGWARMGNLSFSLAF
jgi:hypothetical protein